MLIFEFCLCCDLLVFLFLLDTWQATEVCRRKVGRQWSRWHIVLTNQFFM